MGRPGRADGGWLMRSVFAVKSEFGDGSAVVGRRLWDCEEGAKSEVRQLRHSFPRAFVAEEVVKPARYHAVIFRTPAGATEIIVCLNVETMLEWELLHRRAVSDYGWRDWEGRKYLEFLARTYPPGTDGTIRFASDCTNRLRVLSAK